MFEYFGIEISYVVAFGAGMALFFSPCLLPVLPGFFAFIGGSAYQEHNARWRLFRATFFFVIGFSLIFILLGIGANFLGNPLTVYRSQIQQLGGFLLIFFGFFLMGLVPIPALQNEKKFPILWTSSHLLQNFVYGMIFGFAWTPCIGPVLGTILFFATTQESAVGGGFLLLAFSFGMAVPFLLSSLFVPELGKLLKKVRFLAKYSKLILGSVIVLVGVLLLTGSLESLSAWFTDQFGFTFFDWQKDLSNLPE